MLKIKLIIKKYFHALQKSIYDYHYYISSAYKRVVLNKKIFTLFITLFLFTYIGIHVQYMNNVNAELNNLSVRQDRLEFIATNVAVKQKFSIKAQNNLSNLEVVDITPKLGFKTSLVRKELLTKSVVRGIEISPDIRFEPSTEYTIKLLNRNLWGRETLEVIKFSTQKSPDIINITPTSGSRDIELNQTVEIDLDAPQSDLRDLDLVSDDPSLAVSLQTKEDLKLVYTLSGLQQSNTYSFRVIDKLLPAEQQVIRAFNFSTIETPIISASHSGLIFPNQQLSLNFSVPIQTKDNSFIDTNLPYSATWTANQLIINVGNVGVGSSYYLTVKAGLVSVYGAKTFEDYRISFYTNGAVVLTSQNPVGGDVSVDSNLVLQFNQALNRDDLLKHISVTPAIGIQGLNWISDSRVEVVMQSKTYNTTYSVYLTSGIQPIFGLASDRDYSYSFVTETQVYILNVPQYRQQHSLSCEAAALRMALAYRGIYVSDMDVVWRMGYSPRPRDQVNNIWDDPDSMFVGDINGSQNSTGWGVLAGPTARAANSLGVSATPVYGLDSNYIADQIWADRPVIVWGYNGGGSYDPWKTDTGKEIAGYKGEHTRTVIGVKGVPGDIRGFYINDPASGSRLFWTPEQLNSQLWSFGYPSNQGVVIY